MASTPRPRQPCLLLMPSACSIMLGIYEWRERVAAVALEREPARTRASIDALAYLMEDRSTSRSTPLSARPLCASRRLEAAQLEVSN